MLTQEIVDKISDDFGSTFYSPTHNTLCNCLFDKDKPVVEEIIRKHIPGVDRVEFLKLKEMESDYAIWAIGVFTLK